MAIYYSPKVGEIVFCDFGQFKTLKDGKTPDDRNINGRILPEMVKYRLAVVVNGKLNGGCMVVPLSSSMDQDKVTRRWHVPVDEDLIKPVGTFTAVPRWAKSDHVQHVSKARLYKLPAGQYLPFDLVAEIQRAVMRVIGGATLILPAKVEEKQPVPVEEKAAVAIEEKPPAANEEPKAA